MTKTLPKKLALITSGIVLSLFLAEVILRVAGIAYPPTTIPDKERGAALKPNSERWFHDEGEALVRINSAGLRDHEHDKLKPAQTLRIAVLGDSYAEAQQVDINDTFWTVLRIQLSRCDKLHGRQIETINFGVSAYGLHKSC